MQPSPSVLHIIHSGAVGGGPQVVLDLATRLPGRHTVAAGDDGPLLSAARAAGISTVRLPYSGEYSFAASLPTLVRAARKADLVHLHGQFAAFYGVLAARLDGSARVLYTAHFPSFLTDWSLRNKVRNAVAELLPCRLSSLTIACSDWTRIRYVQRRLVDPGRIVTIYNGVAERQPVRPPLAVRAELGLADDAPIILAMGRFTEQKGFDILLSAVPTLLRHLPHLRLVLAGDGERRQDLERQAQELGVHGTVRFVGFRRDIPDLLQIASVVAVPSRYDVFPLVPLEAMMASRPVVASDLPVLREAVMDGMTGVLAPPEPPSLAESLLSLLQDPRRAEDLGRAGRERARTCFSVERMAGEYAKAYERVLEKAP